MSIETGININGTGLTDLTGLENISSLGGSLIIGGADPMGTNPGLINLSGLENLTSIDGDLRILCNPSLANLDGLRNLTSINGSLIIGVLGISVWENDSLSSIIGLKNIDAGTITNLHIYNNPKLSLCEVKSICDYLDMPNGEVIIGNNLAGCNSPEEVQDSCEAHAGIIDIISMANGISISPNPFTTSTTLSYTLSEPSTVIISIFNPQGQLIERIEQEQPKGEQQLQWNADGLPAGIYYFRIQAGDKAGGGKIIKTE
jgi:hypothetical protein